MPTKTLSTVHFPNSEQPRVVVSLSEITSDIVDDEKIILNLVTIPDDIQIGVTANGQVIEYEPGDVGSMQFSVPSSQVDDLITVLQTMLQMLVVGFGRIDDRTRLNQIFDHLTGRNVGVMATESRFSSHLQQSVLHTRWMQDLLTYLRNLDSHLETVNKKPATEPEAQPPAGSPKSEETD